MIKEQFDKLPIDHKLEYIKIHIDLLTDSGRRRMGILSSVSALSAMLLIVATFGDKIIPFNITIKVLLSLLLAIIPMALFFYNLDLKTALNKNVKYLDELLGRDSKKEILEKQTKLNKFIGIFPDIVIYLLAVIIAILIYSIWTK